jgi:hypothetical protein
MLANRFYRSNAQISSQVFDNLELTEHLICWCYTNFKSGNSTLADPKLGPVSQAKYNADRTKHSHTNVIHWEIM